MKSIDRQNRTKNSQPTDCKPNNSLLSLEQTVHTEQHLFRIEGCECQICHDHQTPATVLINKFEGCSTNANKWLFKVLQGLCVNGVPTLKIYFPDICFVGGDQLHVFYTENLGTKFVKMPGTIPVQALYKTMIGLRKRHKEAQASNFPTDLLHAADPHSMHEKYIDYFVPLSFNAGQSNFRLQSNHQQYILHSHTKYLIPAIQDRNIKDNQPFAVIKFDDGTARLFTHKQFNNFLLIKVPPGISFVQSYISANQQAQSLFTAEYSVDDKTDQTLFQKSQDYVFALIDRMNRNSMHYADIENTEDWAIHLMRSNPNEYTKYITYCIVHYLAMASRIFIKHIKINWLLDDSQTVYFLNIFEMQTTHDPERKIKFQLPIPKDNLAFYRNSENLLSIYDQLRASNGRRKSQLGELLSALDPANRSGRDQLIDNTLNSYRKDRMKLKPLRTHSKIMDQTQLVRNSNRNLRLSLSNVYDNAHSKDKKKRCSDSHNKNQLQEKYRYWGMKSEGKKSQLWEG